MRCPIIRAHVLKRHVAGEAVPGAPGKDGQQRDAHCPTGRVAAPNALGPARGSARGKVVVATT